VVDQNKKQTLKENNPKCVPAAKAARMSDSQKRSAVSRKRSKAQGVGGKPTNVATFAKKRKSNGHGRNGVMARKQDKMPARNKEISDPLSLVQE